jgi:hypothetical protein
MENRVLLVVFVFSAISGLNSVIATYIPSYFFRIGFSYLDYSLISILQSSLTYLVNPVLYFVVLYFGCGGKLLNRISSVLISIIVGSLIGYCVGGLLGSFVSAGLLGTGFPLLSSMFIALASLPQHVVGAVIFAFAALAFSDIEIKWAAALKAETRSTKRPDGLILVVALYVLFAFLNVLAIPFLLAYVASATLTTSIIAVLAVFSCIVVAGQLLLAFGLFMGKKWAWIIALISIGSSLMIDILALVEMLAFGTFPSSSTLTAILLTSLFLGFLISLAIFFYLLRAEVRRFFGFVNPTVEAQE